jgi:pentose-5-phosphate-3-epimerase
MPEIIPAILASNFQELKEHIGLVVSRYPSVQIDMCDGEFVQSVSWPYDEIRSGESHNVDTILGEEEGLPYWDLLNFEFDLMVKNAHKQFEFFTRLGPKRIIFHIEAEYTNEIEKSEFKEFLESIDPYIRDTIEIGLAINTTTDIEMLKPFIIYADFVQCMGIEHIGQQGEPFDERVLLHIRSLREMYPELILSVDGAVNT